MDNRQQGANPYAGRCCGVQTACGMRLLGVNCLRRPAARREPHVGHGCWVRTTSYGRLRGANRMRYLDAGSETQRILATGRKPRTGHRCEARTIWDVGREPYALLCCEAQIPCDYRLHGASHVRYLAVGHESRATASCWVRTACTAWLCDTIPVRLPAAGRKPCAKHCCGARTGCGARLQGVNLAQARCSVCTAWQWDSAATSAAATSVCHQPFNLFM